MDNDDYDYVYFEDDGKEVTVILNVMQSKITLLLFLSVQQRALLSLSLDVL